MSRDKVCVSFWLSKLAKAEAVKFAMRKGWTLSQLITVALKDYIERES